jgi:hypothetical protein
MTAAFPPQPDEERARDWLRRQLQWEDVLDALRDAHRGERPAARPQRREPAAA